MVKSDGAVGLPIYEVLLTSNDKCMLISHRLAFIHLLSMGGAHARKLNGGAVELSRLFLKLGSTRPGCIVSGEFVGSMNLSRLDYI